MHSTVTEDDVGTAISTTAEVEPESFVYLYIFVPVVLFQILLTLGSNVVLLILLIQMRKSWTSLNIYLLSISGFNLLLIFNQVSMLVVIFETNLPIPKQICHAAITIGATASIGIYSTHLVLSWDRYANARNPLNWRINRNKAWLYIPAIWVGSTIFGVLRCLLHIEDIKGGSQTCLWTTVGTCNRPYQMSTEVLILISLSVVTLVVYLLYKKTSQELKANEIDKEIQLNRSSTITNEKRQKSVGERTVVSLAIIFTVHFLSELPIEVYTFLYNIVVVARKQESMPSPPTIIPFVLVCISYVTACSPLFLMMLNRRFKTHIKRYLFCQGTTTDQDNEEFLQQLSAEVLKDEKPKIETPKTLPDDPTIFLGRRAKQYMSTKEATTPSSSDCVSVTVQRQDRVSTTTQGAALAAINAGLVLSANGHRVLLNSFLVHVQDIEEDVQTPESTKELDALYLF